MYSGVQRRREREKRKRRKERKRGGGRGKEREREAQGGEVRFDTSRNNPGADWARIDESGGTPDARRRTTRRGEREVNRVARSIFRVPCPRRAGTGLENFGWLERGLGLSTHWQWSVMVTGEQASKRAIEQSSNRATEHTTNQFIHPMHGSVLHPALSRVRYVLARILRARNMYDVLFCESQLAKPRAGSDYSLRSSSFDWKIRFFSPWNSIGL